MKQVLLTALFVCTAFTASAQDSSDQLFTLKNGDVSMTINADKGGKILSLKYQDKEVLSQSRWPESFGSTFWTSPQKEWNWPPVPEFDKHKIGNNDIPFKKTGLQDVTLKLYPDDRHEILNELDKETVDQDLLAWMEERM